MLVCWCSFSSVFRGLVFIAAAYVLVLWCRFSWSPLTRPSLSSTRAFELSLSLALSLFLRRVGVEYSPSMLEPVRPEAVSPNRELC